MTISSRDPAADAGGEPLCARNHRILFDCTETADSTTGTGIQRAVRSIGGALLATRLLQSLLFETPAASPVIYLGIAALLAATATLASWFPARRAAAVDPLIAIRDQ